MDNNKFYMLYAESGNAPTYKHPTLESAQQEAQRLAELLKTKVYVLDACMSVELNKFRIVNLNTGQADDELPF